MSSINGSNINPTSGRPKWQNTRDVNEKKSEKTSTSAPSQSVKKQEEVIYEGRVQRTLPAVEKPESEEQAIKTLEELTDLIGRGDKPIELVHDGVNSNTIFDLLMQDMK